MKDKIIGNLSYGKILKLAVPVSVVRLCLSLLIYIDIYLLSSISEIDGAAYTVANSALNWFLIVGPALMLSGFFKTARYGKKKDTSITLIAILLNSILIGLIIIFSAECILNLFLLNENSSIITEKSYEIMKTMLLGGFSLMVFMSICLYLEGKRKSNLSSYSAIAGLVLKSVITLCLIDNISTIEITQSTSLSRAFMAILLVLFVFRELRVACARLNPKQIILEQLNLVVTGVGPALSKTAEATAFLIVGILIVNLSSNEIFEYGKFYALSALAYMLNLGIASSCTVLTGDCKDQAEQSIILKRSISISTTLMIILYIIHLLLDGGISWENALLYSVTFITILLDGWNVIISHRLRAYGDRERDIIKIYSLNYIIILPLLSYLAMEFLHNLLSVICSFLLINTIIYFSLCKLSQNKLTHTE